MSSKPKQFTTSKAGETGDRPMEFATFKKMGNAQPIRHRRTWCSRGTVLNNEMNESGINNNELKQFAVCWTSDRPENFFLKNKPTHFTINLGCALGKVQRVGTGLTQTVLPQAPMRGLSALNGDPKEVGHFQSQARAPDEFLH